MALLFNTSVDASRNLLPHDGTVNYYGQIVDADQADHYLRVLLQSIEWRNDEAIIFGKRYVTKRKIAWYASQPFLYRYSGTTKTALPWTHELLALKGMVEKRTGETFNSCLLNLYHNGDEGMAWHSDGEPELKKDGAIASLSFGAERKFAFKHKRTGEKVAITLEHGSLLVMKDETQSHWLHRLPPTKRIRDARVNLTFRSIVSRDA
jgi:alkylated DNA repair dioxygenase AlkB